MFARTAKHSEDYVEKLGSLKKLTKAEKQQRLATILADKASGMH